MYKILLIAGFILTGLFSQAQKYQDPLLYGERKNRLRNDSVFQLPIGITGSNNGTRVSPSLPSLTYGYDTAQMRYVLSDSSVRVHTGSGFKLFYPDSIWKSNDSVYYRMFGENRLGFIDAGGAVTWGTITGTLADQLDLQAALDAKVPTTRQLTINGTTYDLSADRSWSVGTVSAANLPLRITGGNTVEADTSVTYNPSLTTNQRLQKIIDSLNAAGWASSPTPTLQQVLDAGSTLTSNEQISTGVNLFTIYGTDASHETYGVFGGDDIQLYRQVQAGGTSSYIYITDSVYLNSQNTAEPESRFILYPDSIVLRPYNGDLRFKGLNNGGTASDSVLVITSSGVVKKRDPSAFAGGGDITGASNVGGGLANFSAENAGVLEFNTFAAADFDLASNLITIDATKWLTISQANTDYLSASTSSTQNGYFGDVYLFDDGTPSHYTRITNSGNNTLERVLSINMNDANRTLSLSGDLTVSATATVSGTNTGDQTITNSSDATSHTVTLSASGGSVQIIEGSGITLTTGGTASNATVTITSTAGGGNVSNSGTPADNQIAIWTGANNIEGTADFTNDGTTFTVNDITKLTGGLAYTSVNTITGGTSSTVGNTITRVLFNPASVISSYTLTMPAAPTDGQVVIIETGDDIAAGSGVVTTLTVSPNAGHTIYGAITLTQLNGGDVAEYQFHAADNVWKRKK